MERPAGIIPPESAESPEDDEREPDNKAKLYGSVYGNLMDKVEERIINLLRAHEPDTAVVKYEYSGRL